MTLDTRPCGSRGGDNLRLVECPFAECGADLRGKSVVRHLLECESFQNWSANGGRE